MEAVQARNAAFAARDSAAGFATEVTDQVQVSLLKADAEERAAAAAKAAEEAEAAAAQAMKAAEVAVKEEMQAQAVVKVGGRCGVGGAGNGRALRWQEQGEPRV